METKVKLATSSATGARKKARKPAARAQKAVSAAAAAGTDLRLFQIWYAPDQLARLDPDFEPYDNCGQTSPLLEFRVLAELSQRPDLQHGGLWGALSWKFGQKTGLTGRALRQWIAAHPGHDVYFCNPHAHTEGLFQNLWLQGETAHPNFLALCRELFAVAGLPAGMLTEIQPAEEFASCNYMVATPAFWRRYVGFVSRVLLAADRGLSPTARAILYSPTADRSGVHANASYLPFVVERLLPVFLRTEGRDLSACKYPVAVEEGNAHVRLLAEMKAFALRSRSLWMATCWLNYRNLVLDKLHGSAWSRQFLKVLTPSEIHFAEALPQKVAASPLNPSAELTQ